MDEEEELIRLKQEIIQRVSICKVILFPGALLSTHQLSQLKKLVKTVKNSLLGQGIELGDVYATRFHALILAQCEELENTIEALEGVMNKENDNGQKN